MRLTQAGTSIPATAVVVANAVAFGNPTVTGFGSLLAQQLHPLSTGNGTQPQQQPVACTSAHLPPPPSSSGAIEGEVAEFPQFNAFASLPGSTKKSPLSTSTIHQPPSTVRKKLKKL